MAIPCPVCSTTNPQGFTFCDGCGVELPTTTPLAAPQPPAPPPSIWDRPVSRDVPQTAAETTDVLPTASTRSSAFTDDLGVPPGQARLGIKKYGAPTGEFIPVSGTRLTVGRFDASSGPVDIDVSGMSGAEHISRRHAELYQQGNCWFVRDLGSTNGVYIKRAGDASFSPRLQEPAALSDGDELAFGNLMLSFHQG